MRWSNWLAAIGLGLGLSIVGCTQQQKDAEPVKEQAAGLEKKQQKTAKVASDEKDKAVHSLANSRGKLTKLDFADTDKLTQLQGRGVEPAPKLKLRMPKNGKTLRRRRIAVGVDVDNYTIQNDDEGKPFQHVHIILDNKPYRAHYDPKGKTVFKNVEPGTHVITAFLAREFHLALKNPEAFARRVVHVRKKTPKKVPQKGKPMLVYSRPKGSYSKSKGQAETLLLDFYIQNVELSEDGYTVRATVDDGKQVLTFTDWNPQVITADLDVGKHTVELVLLDPEGNPVDVPWNPTTRTITITK